MLAFLTNFNYSNVKINVVNNSLNENSLLNLNIDNDYEYDEINELLSLIESSQELDKEDDVDEEEIKRILNTNIDEDDEDELSEDDLEIEYKKIKKNEE